MKAGEAALAGAGIAIAVIIGAQIGINFGNNQPQKVVSVQKSPPMWTAKCDESARVAGITTCLWDYYKLNPKLHSGTFSSDAEAFKDCSDAAGDQFCKWEEK